MNILVATDGTLDPAKTAAAVARLYNDGDTVVVYTAINYPAEFLNRLSESGVKEASEIALAAGHQLGSGDRAAERLSKASHGDASSGNSRVAEVLEPPLATAQLRSWMPCPRPESKPRGPGPRPRIAQPSRSWAMPVNTNLMSS